MSAAGALASRAAALLAQPGVEARPPAADVGAWSLALAEPPDLAALYAATDGIALPDGTLILPRGDVARATAWLAEERSLDWSHDLLIIGEREDLVSTQETELTAKLEDLAARVESLRKDEQRQAAATERLERHSADLAEREQALARLGQSLLSRRNGETVHVEETAPATFAEGLDALSAASRTLQCT